jgi:predicted nucleotidyltransferase
MPNVFKVAEILIAHTLEAHPGEIAIIAYYGSHAKGQASANSDLDLFYIPDEGQAQALCSQFILDDLPYDFWPVSWQFAEGIANAQSGRPWAVAASLIADARVLYHRSPADLDRFMALQARIAELTRQEHRPQMVERALAEFKTTLFQLEQIRLAAAADDLAGLHWASWKFANSVSNCLALLNQTYFSKGWGTNLAQVLQLPQRPADLDTFFQRITASQPPAQVGIVGRARRPGTTGHGSRRIQGLLLLHSRVHAQGLVSLCPPRCAGRRLRRPAAAR